MKLLTTPLNWCKRHPWLCAAIVAAAYLLWRKHKAASTVQKATEPPAISDYSPWPDAMLALLPTSLAMKP